MTDRVEAGLEPVLGLELLAAFPVIDEKGPIGFAAEHGVDAPGEPMGLTVDRPLQAVRLEVWRMLGPKVLEERPFFGVLDTCIRNHPSIGRMISLSTGSRAPSGHRYFLLVQELLDRQVEIRSGPRRLTAVLVPLLLNGGIGHSKISAIRPLRARLHVPDHLVGIELGVKEPQELGDGDDALGGAIDGVDVRWFIEGNMGVPWMSVLEGKVRH